MDFSAVMTRRISRAVALTVTAVLLLPAAAHADGAAAPVNLTEKQLRAFETRLLGCPACPRACPAARASSAARPPRRAATQRWLRSLAPSVRRTVERKERLRKQRANAKKRAYIKKVDAELRPGRLRQVDHCAVPAAHDPTATT